MGTTIYRYLLLVLVLVAAGCGAGSGGFTQQPGMRLTDGVPPPAMVLSGGVPLRLAAGSALVLAGKDFDPEYAQHAAAQDANAIFVPAWNDNTAPSSGLAYAVYWFQPQVYSGQQIVQLEWSTPPEENADLWVGLSNWESGRWDWQRGTASGVLQPSGGLAQYIEPQAGYLLVTIMLLGHTPCALHEIRLGGSLAGGWRMSGHDAQHSHQSEAVSSQTGKLKWQAPPAAPGVYYTGAAIDSSGVAYTGDSAGTLTAFNPNGSVKWRYATGIAGSSGVAVGHDGTVYFGAYLAVIALTPGGAPKWKYGFDRFDDQLSSAPVLDAADNVYVDFGQQGVRMVCLSAAGVLQWTNSLTHADSASGPVLDTSGKLYNTTLTEGMSVFTLAGEWLGLLETGRALLITPVVGPGDSVFVCTYQSRWELKAYSRMGQVLWSFPCGAQPAAEPAVGADGEVYVNRVDGQLCAISPNGKQRWTRKAGGRSSIAIGADGVIYAGGQDCRLYAYSHDGALLWRSEPAGGEFINPAISDSGTLVVCCEDGWVRAFADL